MRDEILTTSFVGGESPYQKVSNNEIFPNSSFGLLSQINIHEDPNYATLMPKPTKVSGTTVTALPAWAVDASPWSTDRYFTDRAGNIYKETSLGVWSVDRAGSTIEGNTGDNAYGQGMLIFADFLYYATQTTIGRKGYLSGTPTYSDDFLSDGTTNVDQSLDASGNTYTLTASINEGATHRQTFVPTRDPLKAIKVLIGSKGTGDWTLTVHDSNNVVVGSATIANASLTSSADNTFTFSSALRVTIGNSYHFHLTSTVADGTVTTDDASDLETADFATLFGILLSTDQFHPMAEMLNFMVIGNGNYLAKWDRALYNPNQITFTPGFEVRTITKWNEFMVIGGYIGESIDKLEKARLYYWDGIGDSFNFFDDLPMGLPNALINDDGVLMGVYGDKGNIYIRSGDGFKDPNKLKGVARGSKIEVFPGAITKWQGNVFVGAAASTDDSNFRQGVYQYGAGTSQLPDALSHAFKISTGNESNTNIAVSCVAGFGKDLYIGWKDDTSYGFDKVSRDGAAVTNGRIESLLVDNGMPNKEKTALKLVITFLPLPANCSVRPEYKLNRASSYQEGPVVTTENATRAEFDINLRYNEIEYACYITSTGGEFVVITAMWLEFDDNKEEINAS